MLSSRDFKRLCKETDLKVLRTKEVSLGQRFMEYRRSEEHSGSTFPSDLTERLLGPDNLCPERVSAPSASLRGVLRDANFARRYGSVTGPTLSDSRDRVDTEARREQMRVEQFVILSSAAARREQIQEVPLEMTTYHPHLRYDAAGRRAYIVPAHVEHVHLSMPLLEMTTYHPHLRYDAAGRRAYIVPAHVEHVHLSMSLLEDTATGENT